MKLGIMQPYFFPYIGYFQAINATDKYILYENVNFIKKGWMNRNSHLLKNNKSCYFIVPLREKSSLKKINEIELHEDDKWRKQILNRLFFNYKKARYFDVVYPLIEFVINYPTNKLAEINYQSIKKVCEYLSIKTEITKECAKYADIEEQLMSEEINKNDFPSLKLENWDHKVVRILEICRRENANIYINAIGGIELYSKNIFLQNNIDLMFIRTKKIEYKQFNNEFIPNLSIIDVLMFNSIEKTNELLNEFDLI
jgi:hypothetical protein